MPDNETVTIVVEGDKSDAAVKVSVNGSTIDVPRNTETKVHPSYAEALTNSGYDVRVVQPDSAGDGGAVVPGADTNLDASTTVKRDGPDDDHGKSGQVDKEQTPSDGYAPAPGAAGAEEDPASPSSPPPELRQDAAEAGAGRPVEESNATGTVEKNDDGFNADTTIDGTVPEVVAKLSTYSAEQLDQVEKAEKDREQPRQGVLKEIERLRKQNAAE